MRNATCFALCLVLALVLAACQADEQETKEATQVSGPEETSPQIAVDTPASKRVEVGCASCIYEMPGVEGCKLAAKIDGKPMLVTGTEVNAHALGLCSGAKQGVLVGEVEGDEFVATKAEIE